MSMLTSTTTIADALRSLLGGELRFRINAYDGSSVTVTGGEFAPKFVTHVGSAVSIEGGVFGNDFRGQGDVEIVGSFRADNGIPLVKIDRGGQITYHGPGQVVAYLLLDMKRKGLTVRALVRRIEGAVIDLLAGFGSWRSACTSAACVPFYQAGIAMSKNFKPLDKAWLVAMMAASLTACGGGDGGNNNPPPSGSQPQRGSPTLTSTSTPMVTPVRQAAWPRASRPADESTATVRRTRPASCATRFTRSPACHGRSSSTTRSSA